YDADTGGAPPRGADTSHLSHQTTTRIQLLQEAELGGHWKLDYGYEFSRWKTLVPAIDLPIGGDIGKLQFSLLRDTRDHLLDARRGRLWSLSFSYAPALLGSTFQFVKGFGQLAVYRPLASQFVWAQSYRIGAGEGLAGQNLFL